MISIMFILPNNTVIPVRVYRRLPTIRLEEEPLLCYCVSFRFFGFDSILKQVLLVIELQVVGWRVLASSLALWAVLIGAVACLFRFF